MSLCRRRSGTDFPSGNASRAARRWTEPYPAFRMWFSHSRGVNWSSSEPILRQRASLVRSAALRSRCLSLAMTCSIGFSSGACAGRQDSPAPARVVHHGDVVRPQLGDRHLLAPGAEAVAVDRPVDDPGRDDPVMAKRGHEGHRIPVPEGRATDQPLAPRRPSPKRSHVGLRPGLIDEHQPFRVDAALTRLPARTLAGNVRSFLLTGERGFFKLSPSAWAKLHIVR